MASAVTVAVGGAVGVAVVGAVAVAVSVSVAVVVVVAAVVVVSVVVGVGMKLTTKELIDCVDTVSKTLKRKYPHRSYEDMWQSAAVGVCNAASKLEDSYAPQQRFSYMYCAGHWSASQWYWREQSFVATRRDDAPSVMCSIRLPWIVDTCDERGAHCKPTYSNVSEDVYDQVQPDALRVTEEPIDDMIDQRTLFERVMRRAKKEGGIVAKIVPMYYKGKTFQQIGEKLGYGRETIRKHFVLFSEGCRDELAE